MLLLLYLVHSPALSFDCIVHFELGTRIYDSLSQGVLWISHSAFLAILTD